MPLTKEEAEDIFECIIKAYSGPINPFRDNLVNALLRIRADVSPDRMEEMREEFEDRGYVRAVSDIADYHRNELSKIETHFKAAFVVGIPIGVVWEGKFVGPSELKELAHYHTEMLKVIKEKFGNP